ncbi:MAG TPA: TonB-dependent receptor [Caulobacteraceae bacterium]|jgi:hypothetical protein
MSAGAALAQAAPQTPSVPPPAAPAKPKAPPTSAAEDARQDAADEAAANATPDIVVKGRRPNMQAGYGAVVGDIAPELTMSPADIQSFGDATVTELLNDLAPETRSDRGRGQSGPVILLNGRRISGLNEVQNIPTEAILRVDILPEELALKYGYSADQRVVNIVLRRVFRAVTGEGVGGAASEGGDPTAQAEADKFEVRRDQRTNVDLKYQYAAGLTDAQRDVTEPAGAPFDFAGNVLAATPGGTIPDLSALTGEPVTVAGVPAGLGAGAAPTLAEFLPFANLPNVADTAADHSLVPATQSLTGNVVIARALGAGINAAFNVTLAGNSSRALQGLPGVSLAVPAGDPFSPFGEPVVVDRYVAGAAPLEQDVDGWTGHVGLALNKDVGPWRLSLTTAYNHGDTITRTTTGIDAGPLQAALDAGSPGADPFGPLPGGLLTAGALSTARAISDGGNVQVLANGPLLKLPAGDLYVSAKLGDVAALAQSSSAGFSGAPLRQSLARNNAQALLNIDLPLTSRDRHVLGALGDLHANLNTAIDDYSDFGLLTTLGYGLNWTPVSWATLIVSETHDHQAPTLAQLDGPVVATPGVRLFDYASGQTVTVTEVSGGNPALQADSRDVMKVGLTLKPIPNKDVTLTANYVDSHIANAIGALPAATAAIEMALPGRFQRGAGGDLTEEDNRAFNFASQDRQELRWGINVSLPVGKQPPARPQFAPGRGRRGGGAGGGFGGAPGGRGGGQGRPGAGFGVQPPEAAPADGAPDENGGPGASEGAAAAGDSGGFPGGGGQGGGAGGYGGGGFGARGGGGFGGGRGGGRGGGFGGGPPTPGGRLQFALYHTIIFRDREQVTAGGPALDFLGGAPMGGAGGQYQHEIEAQFGYTDNGYGVRLSADWKSGTTVLGAVTGSPGDLVFSPISTVNFRLWDDFSPQKKLLAKWPILRGVRLTLNVSNLFNQTLSVRDTVGPTPLIYQPAFLDPTGRTISLGVRKIFY